MRLFRRGLILSWKKILAYPNEIVILGLYSLLQLATTLVFWRIIFSQSVFGETSQSFIYLLCLLGIFISGLQEIFFGLRDFDYLVRTGGLDKYLVKPKNSLWMIIIEKIPLVSALWQMALGLIGSLWVLVHYQISLSLGSFLSMVVAIFVGSLYYQCIYGFISISSLWVEEVSGLQNLFYNLQITKNMPLSLFPPFIQKIFTYFIPTALLSYYPAVILIGERKALPLALYPGLILVVLAFYGIYQLGMKRYASNGG